jgi:hypothetical protein
LCLSALSALARVSPTVPSARQFCQATAGCCILIALIIRFVVGAKGAKGAEAAECAAAGVVFVLTVHRHLVDIRPRPYGPAVHFLLAQSPIHSSTVPIPRRRSLVPSHPIPAQQSQP